jgi:hypothetical protein
VRPDLSPRELQIALKNKLRRRGYGEQFIGQVLPYMLEGFRLGVRAKKVRK